MLYTLKWDTIRCVRNFFFLNLKWNTRNAVMIIKYNLYFHLHTNAAKTIQLLTVHS